jgi:uncharacterized protein YciI
MAKFVYIFVGGAPSEDKRDENMKDWGDWIAGLQDKKVYVSGLPFGWTKKIVAHDGSVTDNKTETSGYVVVEAESLDQAVEWAKTSPVGKYGGKTEVYDVLVMPGM